MFNFIVVDDEAIIRNGISNIVCSIDDCNVLDKASNGAEAIEKIKQYDNVDIVITDIKMPDMNGLEFCKYISNLRPDIKIIILTGYPDFKYAQEAILYGVVEFLLKPTNKDELELAINKAKKLIDKEFEQENINKEYKLNSLLNELFFGNSKDTQSKLKDCKFSLENCLIALI